MITNFKKCKHAIITWIRNTAKRNNFSHENSK